MLVLVILWGFFPSWSLRTFKYRPISKWKREFSFVLLRRQCWSPSFQNNICVFRLLTHSVPHYSLWTQSSSRPSFSLLQGILTHFWCESCRNLKIDFSSTWKKVCEKSHLFLEYEMIKFWLLNLSFCWVSCMLI